MQAVDEVASALCRVQRLHGLLLGVGAQRPGAARGRERQQPPPAAAPGRRPRRGGGRARPQAACGPAPQQRQQPGHGGLRSGDPRGSPGGRFLARLREEEAGLSPTPPRCPLDRQPRRRAPCTPRARATVASSSVSLPFPKAHSASGPSRRQKLSQRRPGRESAHGEGRRVVRAGASRPRRSRAGGRFRQGFVSVSLIFQRDESATRRPSPAPPSSLAGFPTLLPALVPTPYRSRALKAAALSSRSRSRYP